SPDELKRHYGECKRLFDEARAATGLSYLGVDEGAMAEEVPRRDVEKLLDMDHFVTAFRTSERAVDPRVIADRLRAAVRATPRIRFIGNARVTDVAWSGSRLGVSFRVGGDEYAETYDQVANALWHGRLSIDARLGLRPERAWIYRYKLGGWVNVPLRPETIPSVTVVLGPFGDLVNLTSRGLYL